MTLPAWATILLFLVIFVIAIFPPRLHFGIRFLVLVGLLVFGWLLGTFAFTDVYLPVPGTPEDFPFSMMDLAVFSVISCALGLVIAFIAWVIRKLLGRGAAAEG